MNCQTSLVVQDADGFFPIAVFGIYMSKSFFITQLHQFAAFGAFHHVAYNCMIVMAAKNIFLLKIKRPEAGDIHIDPPASFFEQQFVAKNVGEAGITALAVSKLVFMGVSKYILFGNNEGCIFLHHLWGQRGFDGIINPKVKLMAVGQKGMHTQKLKR